MGFTFNPLIKGRIFNKILIIPLNILGTKYGFRTFFVIFYAYDIQLFLLGMFDTDIERNEVQK